MNHHRISLLYIFEFAFQYFDIRKYVFDTNNSLFNLNGLTID